MKTVEEQRALWRMYRRRYRLRNRKHLPKLCGFCKGELNHRLKGSGRVKLFCNRYCAQYARDEKREANHDSTR